MCDDKLAQDRQMLPDRNHDTFLRFDRDFFGLLPTSRLVCNIYPINIINALFYGAVIQINTFSLNTTARILL